ncbi:hypothetical protein TSUD_195310 [Trifolium subterraneum]|nr:hypothetical protein TSUD_195310 [Trifolium subterraneum]
MKLPLGFNEIRTEITPKKRKSNSKSRSIIDTEMEDLLCSEMNTTLKNFTLKETIEDVSERVGRKIQIFPSHEKKAMVDSSHEMKKFEFSLHSFTDIFNRFLQSEIFQCCIHFTAE